MDYNNFSVIGRLTADPELKTVGGTSLLVGNIAYNDRFNADYANYMKFNMWGKFAEAMSKYLKKGTKVFISGTLKHERWEVDGEKKSNYCLNIEDMVMLDGKAGPKNDSDEIEKQAESKKVEVKAKAMKRTAKASDGQNIESVPF